MAMFVYPASLRDLKSKLECESFRSAGSAVQRDSEDLGEPWVCAEGEGKLRRRLCVLVRRLSSFCSTELTCCLLRLLDCSLFSPALLLGHPLTPVPWTPRCGTNLENSH